MAKRDYYDVLGVDRNAGDDELKSAYRKLAMEHHPDRNPDSPDSEDAFKEVTEAYEILKDKEHRAAYDQFGHAAFEQGTGPGARGGFEFSGNFSDIFEDLFGEFTGRRRGARQQRNRRGADLRCNVTVTLEDAFSGKKSTIQIPTSASCETCEGSGAAPGSSASLCSTCNGAGRVRAQQGFFSVERTCPDCHGQGKVIKDPCKDCRGEGRVAKERTLQVNIPPGVDDGTRIRLSGEGEAGAQGAPAGDLYLFVSVEHHPIFRRDGRDIHIRVPTPMTTAALGGQIEVPTLDGGMARVTVPQGSQSGRQFRLRGKGMPILQGSGRGDMYVQSIIETPVNLTRKQKELLRDFDEAGGKHNPETDGFLSKVRELWEDLTE